MSTLRPSGAPQFRLGVVIPLKPRSVSNAWDWVERCLTNTLSALHGQSSPAWEAVVVGHDKPDVAWTTWPRISFVHCRLPPPNVGAGGRVSEDLKYRDMFTKRALGMEALANPGISHWFNLDADDLLHVRFVETLAGLPRFDMAVVRRGYLYFPVQNRYRPVGRLDRICGSTLVTSGRLWNDPLPLHEYRAGMIGHRMVDAYAASRGVPVCDYPGRGVAYTLGYGDNVYRTPARRVRTWISSRFLSRRCDKPFLDSFRLGNHQR